MDPLTIRGYLSISVVVALVAAVGINSYLAIAGTLTAENGIFTCVGCAFIGFMIAGCFYFVRLKRELNQLQVSRDQLKPNERVLRDSGRPIVHYKTGNTSKTWQAVGGKLFLTSERLIFLAHRSQPWHYQIYLPLTDIVTVEPCDAGPGVPGALAVILPGGRREVFGWGAIGFREADEWTDMVMAESKKARRS